MLTKKVVELLAEFPESWEAAAQQAVDDGARACAALHPSTSRSSRPKVENNRVTSFRINAKVTFEVEQT